MIKIKQIINFMPLELFISQKNEFLTVYLQRRPPYRRLDLFREGGKSGHHREA